MDGIRSWAITLCFAALAAGMAGIIAPKGNMEKVFKFTVSLFFLCCILVPVFNLKHINLNIQIPDTSKKVTYNMQDEIKKQVSEESEKKIKDLVEDSFQKTGVEPRSITVDVDVSQDGSYQVKSIKAVIKHEYMKYKESLINTIKNDYGLDIEITEGE